MAIGALLAAYRLLGVGDMFKELIKKDLQPAYDYVIGRCNYITLHQEFLMWPK